MLATTAVLGCQYQETETFLRLRAKMAEGRQLLVRNLIQIHALGQERPLAFSLDLRCLGLWTSQKKMLLHHVALGISGLNFFR